MSADLERQRADLDAAITTAKGDLDRLRQERAGLDTVAAQQRAAEERSRERAVWALKRAEYAKRAEQITEGELLPHLKGAVAAVGKLLEVDKDDTAARYALAHDLGADFLSAEALYGGARLRPSSLWELLRELGPALERLEREHPRRRQGMR